MNGSTVRLCFVSGRERKNERVSDATTINDDDNDNEMKDYDANVEFLG